MAKSGLFMQRYDLLSHEMVEVRGSDIEIVMGVTELLHTPQEGEDEDRMFNFSIRQPMDCEWR